MHTTAASHGAANLDDANASRPLMITKSPLPVLRIGEESSVCGLETVDSEGDESVASQWRCKLALFDKLFCDFRLIWSGN